MAKVYSLQFAAFTVLAFLERRGDALNWDSDLLKSAGVYWLFIAANSLLAPLVIVLVSLADAGFRDSGIHRIPEDFWLFAPAFFDRYCRSDRGRFRRLLEPSPALSLFFLADACSLSFRHADALYNLVLSALYRIDFHSGRLCASRHVDGRVACRRRCCPIRRAEHGRARHLQVPVE